MNAKKIEFRAVIKLGDYLSRNDFLEPDIRNNDKTPSWDGEVFVYQSNSPKKDQIAGKVSIQVKGTVMGDICKDTIIYPFDAADLRNYKKSGGVILFVVYMQDYDTCKIYYNALLPYDLALIVSTIGKKKSRSITLHTFPKDDAKESVNIFFDFLSHIKKQVGTVKEYPLTVKDIENGKIAIDGYYFAYSGIGINEINADYIITHPTYMYAKLKDLEIDVPIAKTSFEVIQETSNCPVTVDGEVIYQNYETMYSMNKKEIHIGESVIWDITNKKINIKLKGSLSQRIVDVKFIIDIFEGKDIKIKTIPLGALIKDPKQEYIEEFEQYLIGMTNLKLALDNLGVKKDLVFEQWTEKEEKLSNMLIDAFVKKIPVKLNLPEDYSTFVNLDVGNIVLAVAVTRLTNNECLLHDLFNGILFPCKTQINGQEYPISQFVILKKWNFINTDNLKYDVIVKSIKQIEPSVAHCNLANSMVLELILAYDELNNKDETMLIIALDIIEWIIEHDNTSQDVIYILNKYQIIKRMRNLTSEELEEIIDMKSHETDEQRLVGACILLDSFVEAEIHFSKLTSEEQEIFKKYPIYTLWQKNLHI